MATGPDHYREAERLLAGRDLTAQDDLPAVHCDPSDTNLAAAQVHATLALAAAVALSAPVDGSEPGFAAGDFSGWYKAASALATPQGGESDG